MDNAWALISLIGKPEVWLLASLVLIIFYFILRERWERPKRRLMRLFIILMVPSLLLTLGTTYVLKEGFDISRPCITCPAEGCNLHCPADSSFPSGHAATVFAGFSSLVLALRKKWSLVLFIIPVLVSLSRFFLGVHTVLDIVGGTALGVVLAVVVFGIKVKL
jgi:undecaprenyl-diphosphatase